METICICCPIGCNLKVEEKNGEILVTGNSCPRGKAYGITEFTAPKRVLTTSVVLNDVTYTLKTTDAILKDELEHALKEIKKLTSIEFLSHHVKTIFNILRRNLMYFGVKLSGSQQGNDAESNVQNNMTCIKFTKNNG